MNESLSQGIWVKSHKEKKKVPRCLEEMKEVPNIAVEEDNQSEMDQCWKNVAERMEEEVLDKYKVEESKREAFRGRGAVGMEEGAQKQEIQNKKVVRRLLGKNFLLV